MLSIMHTITKLLVGTLVLSAVFHLSSASAAPVTYVSSTGLDANTCTAAAPCATFFTAFDNTDQNGQISCIDSPGVIEGPAVVIGFFSVTVDCFGVYMVKGASTGGFVLNQNGSLRIRNLTINGQGGGFPAIKVTGSGNLVLENCVFEAINGSAALDIEPNAQLNVVIANSRISSSTSGILFKPATGGFINATLDRVTVTNNVGGGIKSDSSSGLVTVDVTDSTISNNGGNGINAVGAGDNVFNIEHSVISKNAVAGVQANGPTTGAIISRTLFDQNAGGATSALAGGNIFTYGDNRIVGLSGSGFTSSAPLR
jgi:hypothetical protein